MWLLFKGGIYFFGIYTSLAKYKKPVKKNKQANKQTTKKKLKWAWIWLVWRLQQSCLSFLKHRCFATKQYTRHFQFIPSLSFPSDFTRRPSPRASKSTPLGTCPTISFPLFVHTAKRSWLFPSSLDTESTSPLRHDTHDDADPFSGVKMRRSWRTTKLYESTAS